MLPDWSLEVGIVASVLALASLLPFVYRFLVQQLWPYSVEFELPGGSLDYVQAGTQYSLHVDIRNRTPDVAFFQFGTFWLGRGIGLTEPVECRTFKDYPATEPFSGHLKVGPLEHQRVVIMMIPALRGTFRFSPWITEFFHTDKYPWLTWFQTRLLRRHSPRTWPRDYSFPIEMDVRTWARPREELRHVLGRDMTTSEREEDDAYELAHAGRKTSM